jgi:tetratricopeptide (TPR) repeat protein
MTMTLRLTKFIRRLARSVLKLRVLLILVGISMLTPVAYSQITADTLVRQLLKENKFGEALSLIESELKRRPKDGQWWLLKGAALSMSNQNDAAIRVFNEMIVSNMEVASAYNNLAVIQADQGNFDSARIGLEAALRHKPDYVIALHNLGNVHANLAALAYKRALHLDQTDQTLPTKLSRLGEALGKTFSPGGEPQFPVAATKPSQDVRTPAAVKVAAVVEPPQAIAVPPAASNEPAAPQARLPVTFKWESASTRLSLAASSRP